MSTRASGRPARVAVVDLFAGGITNFERDSAPQAAAAATHPDRLRRLHAGPCARSVRRRPSGHGCARHRRPGRFAPRLLLATIEQAESRSLGAVVRMALDGIDPTARDAVLLAVTRAHQRLSPEGLARLLALPQRTISQRLARAGFPAPQRLLSWGPLDRRRASARGPAPQRRPRRDSARFSVGKRVSQSLPALPELHAERDSSARRRGVRARDMLLEIGAPIKVLELFAGPPTPETAVGAKPSVAT